MPEKGEGVGKRPAATEEGRPVTDQPQPQPNEKEAQMGRTAVLLNQTQRPCDRVAQLIGKKAIKCHINGFAVPALLDTGAQVSIIDTTWKSK